MLNLAIGSSISNLFSNYTSVLLLLTINLTLQGQPENWAVRNYTTSDGLSSNHVNCIIKDHTGFIWFGTDNGLNRFDGYTFATLELAIGDPHPLSNAEILNIIQDRDNILWIGTSEGLFRYDPSMPVSQIRHYTYLDSELKNTGTGPQPVNFMCEDRNGLIWMTCLEVSDFINFGLRTFDKGTKSFNYIRPDSSFNQNPNEQSSGYVVQMLCDSQGELWLGTNYGLCRYQYGENTFERFVPFPDNRDPLANEIIAICESNKGYLWLGNRSGYFRFYKQEHTFSQLVSADTIDISVTFNLHEDLRGNLWVRENWSIIRILNGNSNGTIERWTYPYSDYEVSQHFAFFPENESTIWVGATGYGVYQIIVDNKNFETIKPEATWREGEAFRAQNINGIIEDSDSNLWIIAREPGITILDKFRSSQTFYPVYDIWSHFNSINKDQYGNIWIASLQGYVARIISDEKGQISHKLYYPKDADPASLSVFKSYNSLGVTSLSIYTPEHIFYKDRYGILWFNTGLGIHDRYDEMLDGFVHLDHRKVDFFNNDTCFEKEIEGSIWIPTVNGLLRLIPPYSENPGYFIKPEKVICYRNDPELPGSLSSNLVRTIYISKNHEPGTIWIGTMRGGLNKLIQTPIEGTNCCRISFNHYTNKDGLCDNNVLGIQEDEHGILWLSTLNGLSRFDPVSESFKNYYDLDGLPTNRFNYGDPCKGKKGEIYFTTEFGVLTFHPDSIEENPIIPPIVITGMYIFNMPVYPGENSTLINTISYTESIDLSYKENHMAFEYAALNFEKPEKNKYKYMLEGLDKDWIQAGTRRYAEYTNLRHGDYTFRVSGSNNDGIWNEDGTSVHIHIHPPPWHTWYAYLVYGLLIIAIILWYRRYLQNRARLRMAVEVERIEKEKILEMDQIRSRFFANISHEFRTPLTLIRGPLDELNRIKSGTITLSRDLLSVMRRNTMRLQRLINQLLDLSKLETGKATLQVSEGNLDEFVKTIVLSFLSLAESRQIKYEYNASETPRNAFFDPDKVEKILTNLISNAFKYTSPRGTISIRLDYKPPAGSDAAQPVESEPFAELMVSDTGIGIPPDKLQRIFDRFYQVSNSDTREEEGTGIGLALTKELVDLYRGEIRVESKPGSGSTFWVRFPVSKEQFREEEILVPGEEVRAEPLEPVIGLEEPELSETRKIRSTGKGKDAPTILIVEDNVDLRNYISDNLGSNYKVLMAENGKLGLECAKESIPDLVISDVMMPVMDGMEMCSLLKQDQRTSHIPVIMLTAKADRGSKMEGLETGADDYIIKPFDTEELQVRVKNLIEQRTRLREKFMREFSAEDEWHIPSSPDDQLLQKILDILNKHLSEPEFNVDQMSDILNMSRRQLFRKTSAVTGYTPKDLIRNLRIKKAASLFRGGHKHVAQVMHQVGFNSQSHFGKCFSEFYGMPPSKYINQKHS